MTRIETAPSSRKNSLPVATEAGLLCDELIAISEEVERLELEGAWPPSVQTMQSWYGRVNKISTEINSNWGTRYKGHEVGTHTYLRKVRNQLRAAHAQQSVVDMLSAFSPDVDWVATNPFVDVDAFDIAQLRLVTLTVAEQVEEARTALRQLTNNRLDLQLQPETNVDVAVFELSGTLSTGGYDGFAQEGYESPYVVAYSAAYDEDARVFTRNLAYALTTLLRRGMVDEVNWRTLQKQRNKFAQQRAEIEAAMAVPQERPRQSAPSPISLIGRLR